MRRSWEKAYYELRIFRKRFVWCVILFLVPIWGLAWYCCAFDPKRATVLCVVFGGFAACVYGFSVQTQKRILNEADKLSDLMIDVVEGRMDYDTEVYREGTIGLLYTNFYKMVTVLRESRLREGEEKEFLKEAISDISHQLKTPLASLMVFVDLLYEEKLPGDKQKEVLAESRKQLERMEWMVLAMLKLARIEAGSVRFEMSVCNVDDIIREAMEGVRYLMEKRRQTIVLETSREIKLLCDREWLVEAILNLLKNASDYSAEYAKIIVRLEDNDLLTRIHIQDEGVGIPQEALPHIFKRFYRADNAVNPGSVGIGLSLSKAIIEGIGGKIKVKSEVGKYTCFTLSFLK